MDRIEHMAERVSQGLALIGAIGVVLMLLHVGTDVAMRNISGRPIPATNEIVSSYYMVLITFLPLAWIERRNGMVSVEFIDWILGPRVMRISDIFVALFTMTFYALLSWSSWGTAIRAFKSGSFVDAVSFKVSIWPTYFLPTAGFALAAIVVGVRLFRLVKPRPVGDIIHDGTKS